MEKEALEMLIKWGFESFAPKLKHYMDSTMLIKLSDSLNQEEFLFIADVMTGVPQEYDIEEIVNLFSFADMNLATSDAWLKSPNQYLISLSNRR